MKNPTQFIDRYLSLPGRWKRWISTQSILFLVTSCVFMATISWTAPLSIDRQRPETYAYRQKAADRAASLDVAAAISKGAGRSESGNETVAMQQATATANPTPAATSPTATALPPEYANNSQQTFGLTLTATVLVVIVVIGVLLFLPKKNDQ